MADANPLGSLGGIGMSLVTNLMWIVGAIGVSAGLYFGVRWIQKKVSKQRAYTTQAIIVDLNGVIDLDMMAFVKSEDTGLLEMEFQIRRSDTVPPIPKHLIKNGIVLLLNYAPGHYCVIDTSQTVRNFDLGNGKVIPFNLGMKKYITARHREILARADRKKKQWETYAPWIALGSAVALACILSAFFYYMGAKFEASNLAARIIDCRAGGYK